jgi:hypothetical protein
MLRHQVLIPAAPIRIEIDIQIQLLLLRHIFQKARAVFRKLSLQRKHRHDVIVADIAMHLVHRMTGAHGNDFNRLFAGDKTHRFAQIERRQSVRRRPLVFFQPILCRTRRVAWRIE